MIILENENQRIMLLDVIAKVQYPGSAIKVIHQLVLDIENAPIYNPAHHDANYKKLEANGESAGNQT